MEQTHLRQTLQKLTDTCNELMSDLERANRRLAQLEGVSDAKGSVDDDGRLLHKVAELRRQRDFARLKAITFKGRCEELKRIYEPHADIGLAGSDSSLEFSEEGGEGEATDSDNHIDESSWSAEESRLVCHECYRAVPASALWNNLCDICLGS